MIPWTVLVVLALETVQVVSFFRSSYFRFVEHFGQIQTELIWADSLQLLAAYLSTFTVQLYFASRIHALANRLRRSSLSLFGVYLISPCFHLWRTQRLLDSISSTLLSLDSQTTFVINASLNN
ncbi:hypothetical protein MVEN_00058100 [Mycena venus]|uniref:Uncharacterized protein n=1 Tax=Mycena venus TaxID=2733690 RepID=A0A8H6Z3N4_9AGAR|nr:hypothetical protein MVEN_00058100 [Mycena venus]